MCKRKSSFIMIFFSCIFIYIYMETAVLRSGSGSERRGRRPQRFRSIWTWFHRLIVLLGRMTLLPQDRQNLSWRGGVKPRIWHNVSRCQKVKPWVCHNCHGRCWHGTIIVVTSKGEIARLPQCVVMDAYVAPEFFAAPMGETARFLDFFHTGCWCGT